MLNSFRLTFKIFDYFACFSNTEGGPKGPEAYYPRTSNTSLLMTRSIGDKNGPRGCLARADITAVSVHATQHARYVCISKGFVYKTYEIV